MRHLIALVALCASGAAPAGSGAQLGASGGDSDVVDDSCSSSPGESTWRAVGNAVVGGGAQRGTGGEWVSQDEGPGVWYFSSEDVFRCGKGSSRTLAFELGHRHFDSAGQEPLTGHPDVVLRCRGGGSGGGGGAGQGLALAAWGVVDPWAARTYRIPLSATGGWVHMEGGRRASDAEVQAAAAGCAAGGALLVRGGFFAGPESAYLKVPRAIAPPPPRTKWTRRVPHPVLIGHAASLTPY